jgi:hypothetical protein
MSNGQFVWYELMTTDPKAAIAFYTEVVGWKTQPYAEAGKGDGEPYQMWVGGQGPLGGVMTLPEVAKQMGAPPHWMAHVEVADVDATVAKVKELGGKIYVPPTVIPTVGRFSVIADPQGASISVFHPDAPMKAHDNTKAGEFCWHELYAGDNVTAFPFYAAIFGWERLDEMDMGPMGKYVIFGQGDRQYGGMMTKPPNVPMPPAWGYYVEVDDLDAALARAKANGAKVVNGPMDVPGNARVVQLTDPQGAYVSLHAPRK